MKGYTEDDPLKTTHNVVEKLRRSILSQKVHQELHAMCPVVPNRKMETNSSSCIRQARRNDSETNAVEAGLRKSQILAKFLAVKEHLLSGFNLLRTVKFRHDGRQIKKNWYDSSNRFKDMGIIQKQGMCVPNELTTNFSLKNTVSTHHEFFHDRIKSGYLEQR